MKGRIFFYITTEELQQGLERLEAARPVKYVLAGMFDEPEPVVYNSYVEIPKLGQSKTGYYITDINYFIMPRECDIDVQEVKLQRGGIRYMVSTFEGRNQNSIYWQTGGEWDKEIIITSCIQKGLLGLKTSTELFNLFKKNVLKDFEKIGMYFVSPKCAALLDSGGRLTDSAKGIRDIDLSR